MIDAQWYQHICEGIFLCGALLFVVLVALADINRKLDAIADKLEVGK